MNTALISRTIVGSIFLPSHPQSLVTQGSLTALRVIVGAAMVHNGLDKLADIPGFASAYVEVIGLPFPVFLAYCAALTETIAAPLLILGAGTRLAAAGLCSTMLVAMYHHILVAGFSVPYLELSLVYAACFLFFALNGGGKYSIDTWIARLINRSQIQTLEASLQHLGSREFAAKAPNR